MTRSVCIACIGIGCGKCLILDIVNMNDNTVLLFIVCSGGFGNEGSLRLSGNPHSLFTARRQHVKLICLLRPVSSGGGGSNVLLIR